MANYDLFLFDGHGDGDSGAVGNGRQEHNEAKRFNNKVCDYLKPTGLKIHRGINNYKNNLLNGNTYTYKFGYSTHLNSASATATGTEILVQPLEKYLSVETNIANRISKLTGLQNRGLKSRCYNTGDWYKRIDGSIANVKDYFKETRDARDRGLSLAILELCFISNKDDMAKFDKYFDDMAFIVADEIAKYCNKSISKPTTPTPTPTPTPPNSSGDTYYRVVCGSFKDKKNALEMQEKLKKAGFDSFLDAYKK